MEEALDTTQTPAEQDRRISEAFEREQPRLRSFIRRRVADSRDAEDILQEVFTELVEAYRLFQNIDQAGAWLFRVARNRIVDLFRKKKPVPLSDLAPQLNDEGEEMSVEELLPSPDAGPEAAFARLMLVEELEEALDELPAEQREAFVAHEIEGVRFKELAERTGVGVNTLLTRKRLAVLYLRERLKDMYDELSKLQPARKPVASEKTPGRSREFSEWVKAVVSGGSAPKELRHE
jgi:RNA polymerase sigma factor (sigma-70 family)